MKWLIQAIVALLIAAGAGVYAYQYAPTGVVNAIRVTKTSTMPDIRILTKPDYYIVLQLHSGETLQLPTYSNRPIGNGLIWTLQEPVSVSDIAEVQLFDEDIFSDEMLDRVIVNTRMLKGERHGFELIGPESDQWLIALAIGAPIALYFLFALIMFIRWQAIPPRSGGAS